MHKDHDKNRIAWNEMVEIHFNHPDYKLKEFLNGWNSLKEIERTEIGDVNGKDLLHLMCQFGMDTLSWARLGANVTGVDISEKSIEYAEKLKEMAKIPEAKFVLSDVLEIDGKLDQKYDIIFQSHGTHCWISDLTKWAQLVAKHLKPGGFFYIVDLHPYSVLWETENMSYLAKEPERYQNEHDYCDRDKVIPHEMVEWQHPISEFINCLVDAGLSIDHMNEFDKSCYGVEADWYQVGDYWYPPGGAPRHPLLFSLKATKQA